MKLVEIISSALSELGRQYQEAIIFYFAEKSTSQLLEELVMYHQ